MEVAVWRASCRGERCLRCFHRSLADAGALLHAALACTGGAVSTYDGCVHVQPCRSAAELSTVAQVRSRCELAPEPAACTPPRRWSMT